MRRAVFLDRDGVINADLGYVGRREDFRFLPGVPQALSRLSRAGWLLVVCTNQSGIARGRYTEEDFARLDAWMRGELERAGAPVAGTFFCPHHPEAKLPQYRVECACRKPQPGLFLQAVEKLGIDVSRSVAFGDKRRDLQAAQAAGVPRRILVGTDAREVPAPVPEATGVARSLPDALGRFPELLSSEP